MRLVCHKPVLNLEGQQIKHGDGRLATLRSIISDSITGTINGDQVDGGHTAYALYKLAKRLHAADFVDLTDNEVHLIRLRVGNRGHSYTVVGRVFEMLDEAMNPKAHDEPVEVIVDPRLRVARSVDWPDGTIDQG